MTPAPPVQVLGTAILLQDNATSVAYFLVSEGIRSCRARGIRPTSSFFGLQRALADAVRNTDSGHVDDQGIATSAASDTIDSSSAATILGTSRRNVFRLAHDLGGVQQPNKRWVFDRRTVEDFAAARRAA